MSEYYNNQNQNGEIGWDDAIENDSPEFELLPEGDYNFRVVKFDRARHPGSDKLPSCNKAVVTLEVSDGVHTGLIQHNLFLHRKTEGLLCAFFTAIGQRKHGEKLNPHWEQIVGASGTCKVGIRPWTGRNGEKRESNQIERFYEPGTPAQQNFMQQNAGYSAGKF